MTDRLFVSGAVGAGRAVSSVAGQYASRLVLLVLRGYQLAVSPLFAALGSQCRFEPSCSQYMIDAVHSRGAIVGLVLGLWRVLRCNPFNPGGYDPAPAERVSGVKGRDVSRETV